jgi:N-acylneuraminate cytidylyltransferase
MLLQATSPVRFPGTLDRAVEQFRATSVDSLVGVVPQPPFLWTLGPSPSPQYQPERRPRRQELVPTDYRYRETGSLYLTKTSVYTEFGNRLGGQVGLFVMDEREGVDVDTELDLLIAEQHLDWFRGELEGKEQAS